jgi:hypothetical protein
MAGILTGSMVTYVGMYVYLEFMLGYLLLTHGIPLCRIVDRR